MLFGTGKIAWAVQSVFDIMEGIVITCKYYYRLVTYECKL
jgi:hypothetical protein